MAQNLKKTLTLTIDFIQYNISKVRILNLGGESM